MRCAIHSLSKQQLVDEFKNVLEKAEALVTEGAGETSERFAAARARMEQALAQVKDRAAALESMAIDQAKNAVAGTEKSIQTHPWSAIGLSAGIGLLVGLLISRGNK